MIRHPPVPIVEAVRNVVADAATGDWVLALDPDERVSAGLAAEWRRLSARSDVDAVVVPRMNFDFGYPARSPLQRHEPQLRMYGGAAVRWPSFPNALPEVSEDRVLRLPARDELTLVHDRNRNIPEAIDRVRRYAPAQAQAMIEAGRGLHGRRMLLTLGEKLYRHSSSRGRCATGPGLLRAGLLVAFHLYVWAASGITRGRPERPRRTMAAAPPRPRLRAAALGRGCVRTVTGGAAPMARYGGTGLAGNLHCAVPLCAQSERGPDSARG